MVIAAADPALRPAALVLNEGFALRYDVVGGKREHIVGLQGRVRNAPDVPKLIEDQAASLMHRLGHPAPRLYLLTAVDAGRPGVPWPCTEICVASLTINAADACA